MHYKYYSIIFIYFLFNKENIPFSYKTLFNYNLECSLIVNICRNYNISIKQIFLIIIIYLKVNIIQKINFNAFEISNA